MKNLSILGLCFSILLGLNASADIVELHVFKTSKKARADSSKVLAGMRAGARTTVSGGSGAAGIPKSTRVTVHTNNVSFLEGGPLVNSKNFDFHVTGPAKSK